MRKDDRHKSFERVTAVLARSVAAMWLLGLTVSLMSIASSGIVLHIGATASTDSVSFTAAADPADLGSIDIDELFALLDDHPPSDLPSDLTYTPAPPAVVATPIGTDQQLSFDDLVKLLLASVDEQTAESSVPIEVLPTSNVASTAPCGTEAVATTHLQPNDAGDASPSQEVDPYRPYLAMEDACPDGWQLERMSCRAQVNVWPSSAYVVVCGPLMDVSASRATRAAQRQQWKSLEGSCPNGMLCQTNGRRWSEGRPLPVDRWLHTRRIDCVPRADIHWDYFRERGRRMGAIRRRRARDEAGDNEPVVYMTGPLPAHQQRAVADMNAALDTAIGRPAARRRRREHIGSSRVGVEVGTTLSASEIAAANTADSSAHTTSSIQVDAVMLRRLTVDGSAFCTP